LDWANHSLPEPFCPTLQHDIQQHADSCIRCNPSVSLVTRADQAVLTRRVVSTPPNFPVRRRKPSSDVYALNKSTTPAWEQFAHSNKTETRGLHGKQYLRPVLLTRTIVRPGGLAAASTFKTCSIRMQWQLDSKLSVHPD
jgi:hypothetical protein